MMNNQKLDIQCINEREREILSKWRKAGYITGGATDMTITKQFWDTINELLFMGYVDYE
jgi:hypothetical protein